VFGQNVKPKNDSLSGFLAQESVQDQVSHDQYVFREFEVSFAESDCNSNGHGTQKESHLVRVLLLEFSAVHSAFVNLGDWLDDSAARLFEFFSYFRPALAQQIVSVCDEQVEVRKEFEEAGGAVIKPIAQVYKSGMDSGKFQKQDPDKMAFLLRAVAIGIAVGFREGNLKFPEDILIMRDLVLHGLLGKKS
jgi:hypothetical protein